MKAGRKLAIWPKSSPNLNSCSIKNLPPPDFSIMTLVTGMNLMLKNKYLKNQLIIKIITPMRQYCQTQKMIILMKKRTQILQISLQKRKERNIKLKKKGRIIVLLKPHQVKEFCNRGRGSSSAIQPARNPRAWILPFWSKTDMGSLKQNLCLTPDQEIV